MQRHVPFSQRVVPVRALIRLGLAGLLVAGAASAEPEPGRTDGEEGSEYGKGGYPYYGRLGQFYAEGFFGAAMVDIDPEDEEEAGDPREDLVRRLLEYQQFKEVASWMEDQQAACRDRFYRGAALDMVGLEEDALEACRSVGLFDLLAAFKQALAAAPKVDFHEVERVEVNTEERAEVILDVLAQKERASFVELVSGLPRIVLIVTFIALLELIRTGQVVARQADLNSDIWIYKQEAETEAQEAKTPPGSQRDV